MTARKCIVRMACVVLLTVTVGGCSYVANLFYSQQSYTNSSFSSAGDLVLSGDATVGVMSADYDFDVLRLVASGSSNQLGTAYLPTTIQPDTGFSTRFQFRIDGVTSGSGADGFTFALQSIPFMGSTPTIGDGGGSMGYGGVPHSIAVKFDTYQNSETHDPSSHYIGVALAGDMDNTNYSGGQSTVSTNFDNGSIWTVWIDYDGSMLSVYAVNSATTLKPSLPTLTYHFDAASILSGVGTWVGFTAAGGSSWEETNILNWSFYNYNNPYGS